MASENKLQEVVQATLAQIRNMIDADTVIGTPVETASGTTIIPVSKVSVGFATSGIDFNDKANNTVSKIVTIDDIKKYVLHTITTLQL